VVVALIMILVGVGAATGYVNWPLISQPVGDDSWIVVADWNFADGPFPNGWAYGDWHIADDYLELDGGPADWAVYFTPVHHGSNFILETQVQLVSGYGGKGVRAHLLTRDSNGLTHESGVGLAAAPDRIAVRHMVNGRDVVSDLIPSPVADEGADWHDLKVAVVDGLISAWVDGELVYETDRRGPPGYYTEPHLAAENGVARFRNIRIRSSSGS